MPPSLLLLQFPQIDPPANRHDTTHTNRLYLHFSTCHTIIIIIITPQRSSSCMYNLLLLQCWEAIKFVAKRCSVLLLSSSRSPAGSAGLYLYWLYYFIFLYSLYYFIWTFTLNVVKAVASLIANLGQVPVFKSKLNLFNIWRDTY